MTVVARLPNASAVHLLRVPRPRQRPRAESCRATSATPRPQAGSPFGRNFRLGLDAFLLVRCSGSGSRPAGISASGARAVIRGRCDECLKRVDVTRSPRRTNGRYCANQTTGVIVKASTVTAASRRTIGALWSGKIPAKRGRLPARSFFERTGCGWRPGPWSSYKDYTLPLTIRLRLEGKVGNAFLAASPARDR
jgi:hypothetical protein